MNIPEILKSKKVVLSVLAGVAAVVGVIVFDVPFVDAPKTFDAIQTCVGAALNPTAQ